MGANQLGRGVFAPLFANSVQPANIARFIFLDPASQEFYVEWDRLAADTVALLHTEAGHDPYDPTSSGSCRPAAGSSTCPTRLPAT